MIDKFLEIADNHKFGGASNKNFDFNDADRQNFQQYMQRLPIWDFLNVSKERYLSSTREDKLSSIKNYIQAKKNANTISLSGEFILVCKVNFFVCLFVTSGLVWFGVFELRYF